MRLRNLYTMRFTYPQSWEVDLSFSGGEGRFFFLAEGTCVGRLEGRLTGANLPRRRGDGTFQPDFHGVIETVDGATVLFDLHGYGRSYPIGRRQIVAAITHVSDAPDYRWLNDVVCVASGEVRADPSGGASNLVADVAELVWEPPAA